MPEAMTRSHTPEQEFAPELLIDTKKIGRRKPKSEGLQGEGEIRHIPPMGETEKTRPQHGRPPVGLVDRRPQQRDASCLVGELVDDLINPITAAHKKRLREAIERAQQEMPEDREKFVRDVNRLLDTFNLRIRNGDGDLCRLRLTGGGRGTIQLYGSSQNRPGSFKAAVVAIDDAPVNFRGAHKTAHYTP